MNEPATRKLLRFSVFEADLESGELFKKGQKVKLQGQPFELLVELLKNPNAVVTREQLKERLWPGDTAGDFDSSLNRAINRIREVLGDSAESPHFIETLPRRGYRFIGAVSGGGGVEAPPVVLNADPGKEVPPSPARSGNWKVIALAGIAFSAVSLFLWITHRVPEPPRDVKLRQLTTNSPGNPVLHSVISPDGKYLAYGDSAGIRLQEIVTGQTHAIPRPKTLSEDDSWFPNAWFPDGARLVATAIKTTQDGRVISSSWSVPILGNPILLRDDAIAPSVSPDGSLIAFRRDVAFNEPFTAFWDCWAREIWVMGTNGEDARKLLSSDGKTLFGSIQWSPDSGRIAFLGLHAGGKAPYEPDLKTVGLKGGPPAAIMPGFPGQEFRWIPDGRILYTRAEAAPNNRDNNLWAFKVDSKTGKPTSRPRPVTNVPGFNMSTISVSSDGQKVAVQKMSFGSDIYIGRLRAANRLEAPRRLTSDERANLPFAWTLDSRSVIFISDHTGVQGIYRQRIDEALAELIPTGRESVWLPRATPDGASILYFAQTDTQYPWLSSARRLMRVPVTGGAREVVAQFPAPNCCNVDCPIQPEARCVIEAGSGDGGRTFMAFDAVTGKLRELFTRNDAITDIHQWTVSPDGAHIAELRRDTIEILSLAGEVERTIHITGWPNLARVDWAADGKALLLGHDGPTKATLLRAGLDGQVQPLWEQRNSPDLWAIASPDGSYLAIMAASMNSNAWLLENF